MNMDRPPRPVHAGQRNQLDQEPLRTESRRWLTVFTFASPTARPTSVSQPVTSAGNVSTIFHDIICLNVILVLGLWLSLLPVTGNGQADIYSTFFHMLLEQMIMCKVLTDHRPDQSVATIDLRYIGNMAILRHRTEDAPWSAIRGIL